MAIRPYVNLWVVPTSPTLADNPPALAQESGLKRMGGSTGS